MTSLSPSPTAGTAPGPGPAEPDAAGLSPGRQIGRGHV